MLCFLEERSRRGVREPVVYEEPSERDRRRQERALALHEAEPRSRAEAEADLSIL